MKSILLAILTVSLAGCAGNPAADREQSKSNLRVQGIRYEFNLKKAPTAAAGCVGQNAENMSSLFFGPLYTSMREGRSTGSLELAVFMDNNGQASYSMLAEFSPNDTGSTATAWLNPVRMESARNKLLTAFIGC